MSAVVCGKRSLFDDLHSSPPIAKRIRCGGNSPIRFQSVVPPVRSGPSDPIALAQLRTMFQEIDGQLVERVYETSGKNLDSAIKSLYDLRLSTSDQMPLSASAGHAGLPADSESAATNGSASYDAFAPSVNVQTPAGEMNMPVASGMVPEKGMEWVELLVGEMMNASSIEDARMRMTRALEAFENQIGQRFTADTKHMVEENMALKEKLQGLLRDNHILKRAVNIQHERQLEHEERARELHNVKLLVAQHQEQLKNLELNNYALSLHLKKAQEGSPIPGRFHPDLF